MKIKFFPLILLTILCLFFYFNRSLSAQEFSLIAAGDMTPAWHITQPREFFGLQIRKKIEKADLFLWNCETSGPSLHARKKQFVFKTNEKVLPFFIFENGLASLANNHSLDGGEEGFSSLLVFFKRFHGEAVYGLAPATKVGQKGTAHVFAWTPMYGKTKLFPDEAQFFKTVQDQRLHTPKDFIIVYIHDGKEGTDSPTNRQKYFVKTLADKGADVILFSHSHLYGEIVNPQKIGDPLIIWGLGNAVFGGNRAWKNKNDVRFAAIRLSREMPHSAKWIRGKTINWQFDSL